MPRRPVYTVCRDKVACTCKSSYTGGRCCPAYAVYHTGVMLLQAGKASSPEDVEVAKLQGLGIAGTQLDSPAQWINLRYDTSPSYQLLHTLLEAVFEKFSHV